LALWIAYRWWSVFPFWWPTFADDGYVYVGFVGYVVPLALCFIALLVVAMPSRAAGTRGAAQLTARTPFTFAPRPWLALFVVVIAAIVLVSVSAGLASSPDEAGRYLMYTVQMSATSSASSSIFGWFYSVPCLVLVAIVAATTVLALWAIGRPPLAVDRERDAVHRVTRVRIVLAVASGGLLLHLGTILNSLAGTSALRGGLSAGVAGWVEVGTAFAAMGPALTIAAYTTIVAGLGAWWLVFLMAVFADARTSERVSAR
jgi:hypothetical protein